MTFVNARARACVIPVGLKTRTFDMHVAALAICPDTGGNNWVFRANSNAFYYLCVCASARVRMSVRAPITTRACADCRIHYVCSVRVNFRLSFMEIYHVRVRVRVRVRAYVRMVRPRRVARDKFAFF